MNSQALSSVRQVVIRSSTNQQNNVNSQTSSGSSSSGSGSSSSGVQSVQQVVIRESAMSE